MIKNDQVEHDYGNVHEANSFNELTENGVREKYLYRNEAFARQYSHECDI